MMHLLGQPKINVAVELQESTVVVRGYPEDSVGSVLRGAVVVTVTEPARVRCIRARFRGRLRIWWHEGVEPHQVVREEKRTILERRWVFLPTAKQMHQLEPGVYRYAFEEPFPGDLPETVCVEYGTIDYRIRATVERPVLHYNCTAEREVRVERHMYPLPPEWLDTCSVSDSWEERVRHYSMSIPARAVGCRDLLPIRISWQPARNDTRVRGVICTLIEHVQYAPRPDVQHRDQRCVAQYSEKLDDLLGSGEALLTLSGTSDADDEGGDGKDNHLAWTRTFFFRLPGSDHRHPLQRVQCDSDTNWMRVKHRLRVHVVFEDGLGAAKVYGILPLVVLPQSPQEISADPPRYGAHRSGTLIMSAPNSPLQRPLSPGQLAAELAALPMLDAPADSTPLRRTSSTSSLVAPLPPFAPSPAHLGAVLAAAVQSSVSGGGMTVRARSRTARSSNASTPATLSDVDSRPSSPEPPVPHVHRAIPSWALNFDSLPSYEAAVRGRQNSLPRYDQVLADMAARSVRNATNGN